MWRGWVFALTFGWNAGLFAQDIPIEGVDVSRRGSVGTHYLTDRLVRVEFGRGAGRPSYLFFLDGDGNVRNTMELRGETVAPASLDSGFALMQRTGDADGPLTYLRFDDEGQERGRYEVPAGRTGLLNEAGLLVLRRGSAHGPTDRAFELTFRPLEGEARDVMDPTVRLIDVFPAGTTRWGVLAREGEDAPYQARLYDADGGQVWRTVLPVSRMQPILQTVHDGALTLAAIAPELGQFQVLLMDDAGAVRTMIEVGELYRFQTTDDPNRVLLLTRGGLQVLDVDRGLVIADLAALPPKVPGDSVYLPAGGDTLVLAETGPERHVTLRMIDLAEPTAPARVLRVRDAVPEELLGIVGHRFTPTGDLVVVFPDGPFQIPARAFRKDP